MLNLSNFYIFNYASVQLILKELFKNSCVLVIFGRNQKQRPYNVLTAC